MLYTRTYIDCELQEIDDGSVDIQLTDKTTTITHLQEPKQSEYKSLLWNKQTIRMKGTPKLDKDGTFVIYHGSRGIPFIYTRGKAEEPKTK